MSDRIIYRPSLRSVPYVVLAGTVELIGLLLSAGAVVSDRHETALLWITIPVALWPPLYHLRARILIDRTHVWTRGSFWLATRFPRGQVETLCQQSRKPAGLIFVGPENMTLARLPPAWTRQQIKEMAATLGVPVDYRG